MIRRVLVLLALCAPTAALTAGSNFPVTKIYGQGNPNNRINILVMSEGFTQKELDSGVFAKKADEIIKIGLLKKEPFASYANLIQVHRIDVPSKESGIGDQMAPPPLPTGSPDPSASPYPFPSASPGVGDISAPYTNDNTATNGNGQASSNGNGSLSNATGATADNSSGPTGNANSTTGGPGGKDASADSNSPLYAGENGNVSPKKDADELTPPGETIPGSTVPGGLTLPGAVTAGIPPPPTTCPPPPWMILPGTKTRDTYFGVWRQAALVNGVYASGEIVWFPDEHCAVELMRQVNPRLKRDIVLLLLNTPNGRAAARFTGTASFGYTCIPIHESQEETMGHEVGHCLVNLADEYESELAGTAVPPVEPIEPNVTIESDPAKVKWRDWIDAKEPGIGVVPGGKYFSVGVWRPKQNCLMRELNQELCAICYEAVLQRFYSAVSLIDTVTPLGRTVELTTGQSSTFKVFTVGPRNGKIEAEWTLDGVPVKATKTESAFGPSFEVTLGAKQLVAGHHQLKCVALDNSPSFLGGKGSSQAPVADRRPNQRTWSVHVRQTNGQPRLTPVVRTE